MTIVDVIGILVGLVVLTLVPGYCLSELLFRKQELDTVERMATTLALGILATPTIMLILNKTIRTRITAMNTSIIVLGILAYTLLYVSYIRKKRPEITPDLS